MKNILVTGGSGYIGSILCEALLHKGYAVTCLDRFFFGKEVISPLQKNPHFTIVQDDIRSVPEAIMEGKDAVIDVAGISNDPSCELDPALTEDINFKGSLRICQLARRQGVKRYIFSSSCSVYGSGKGQFLDEKSPLNPVSLYAKTKIGVEKEALKMASPDFCVTILRNATVYGLSPRMRFDLLVNLMTARAVTQRKIFVLGGGKQWRPNIHVRDVARAFLLVLESDPAKVNGEIFNVGVSEQNFQVIQVANMVREVVPYVDVEVVPDDEDKRNYNVNFDKIKNDLGFKVNHSLLEGVAEIKQAIERAAIEVDDPKTVTLKYYKYLMEADKILSEIKLNGRVF